MLKGNVFLLWWIARSEKFKLDKGCGDDEHGDVGSDALLDPVDSCHCDVGNWLEWTCSFVSFFSIPILKANELKGFFLFCSYKSNCFCKVAAISNLCSCPCLRRVRQRRWKRCICSDWIIFGSNWLFLFSWFSLSSSFNGSRGRCFFSYLFWHLIFTNNDGLSRWKYYIKIRHKKLDDILWR